MAEGTNVGNIFLDLIVRNTVGEQVRKIAQEGQETAKKAFSGMEKAAEHMANQASVSAEKVVQKTAAAVSKGFDKSVATARARVKELEQEFERINSRAVEVRWSFTTRTETVPRTGWRSAWPSRVKRLMTGWKWPGNGFGSRKKRQPRERLRQRRRRR